MNNSIKDMITIVDVGNSKKEKNELKRKMKRKNKSKNILEHGKTILDIAKDESLDNVEESKITIEHDADEKIFDKTKGFFVVNTVKREFFCLERKDIENNLTDEEKTYEVSYVEYIGYFAGKTDVICITQGENKIYQTFGDIYTSFIYQSNVNRKWEWKIYPINDLKKFYDEFKKEGLVMRNDVYKRDADFRKAVNKLIN